MAAPVQTKAGLVKNADGYDEVAAYVKPSQTNAWDLPSGQVVELLDDWVECECKGKKGYIKAKNLPGVAEKAIGAMLEVKDSFPANKETCMRRHAEQDSTKGNVLCYVANGPDRVKYLQRWCEVKWRGHRGFVKARHVGPAPEGAEPAGGIRAGAAAAGRAPPARGAPAASSEGAAPAVRGGGAASSSSSGAGAAAAPAAAAPAGDVEMPQAEEEAPLEPPAKKLKVVHEGAAPADMEVEPAAEPVEAAPAADMAVEEAPKEAAPPAEAPAAEAPAAEAPAAPEVPAAEKPGAPEAAAPAAAAAAAPAAPAPAPAPAAPAIPMRDCDCCFESVRTDEGCQCPGKAHFFCKDCLGNFLNAFKTADYAEQKKGKGRALCPMKDSETPFGDGALVAFVPQDIFDDYLQIRIKVAEKGIQEAIEKENAGKIEELKEKLAKATGDAEQLELDKHRLKIIDDIFTLKCPRCGLAFLDYDNCSAVTCAGCSCGFCSYCLEDCGKDAHQHFYKNKSKCPKEGGPIFIDHATWLGYQGARKARMTCEYLATVPEAIRQKVADLVAPDAKDLGIKMPDNISKEALDPKAAGLIRLKLSVPRKLRGQLVEKGKKIVKGEAELNVPDPKAKVAVSSSAGAVHVATRKEPKLGPGKKGITYIPDGLEVEIDDEWLEIACPKEKIANGWIKAKHVVGRVAPGGKGKIKDAGGYGSVLVRKAARQEEGPNAIKYIDDGTEIKAVKAWTEAIWEAQVPLGGMHVKAGRGFLEACDVPDDDVHLQGKKEDCWEAAKALQKVLGIDLLAKEVGPIAAFEYAGGAKGKGRGRGRGRGRF